MSARRLLATLLLLVASPAAAEPRAVTADEVRAAAGKAPERDAAHRRTLSAFAEADAAGPWPATTVTIGTARVSPRLVAIASVPLPIFGVEKAARQTLRAEAEVTRAEEHTTDVDLVQQATVAWLALYRADQTAAVSAETADRLDALVKVTRARRDAGDASDADVVNIETQAARARVEADDAALVASAASADLAAAVGWDPSEELTATGELPGDSAPPLDEMAPKIDQHPELHTQQARISAAEAAVSEARLGGRPVLRAELEVDALDPGGAGTDVLLNLVVDLPIGGRTGKKVAAARARVDAEEAEAAAVRTRLSAELVAAHRRWAAAQKRSVAFGTQLVPAQEKSTDLVRKAYQAGEVDLASVIQAERDLLDVRGEAIDADIAAADAWAALERAAGGSL